MTTRETGLYPGLCAMAKRAFDCVHPVFMVHAGVSATTLAVCSGESQSPVGYIKVGRCHDAPDIQRESRMLGLIHAHGGTVAETVPQVLASDDIGGLPAVALSVVPGAPICRSRDTTSTAARVRGWLVQLASVPAPQDAEPVSRFDEGLAQLNALKAESSIPSKLIPVVEAAAQHRSWLPGGAMKPVITHRDLSPPNVLVDGDAIGVIDWSYSHVGYPLTDWVRFLLHHAKATRDEGTLLEALRELPCHSVLGALFRGGTARYCHDVGIPLSLIAPLTLLSACDFLGSVFHGQPLEAWRDKLSELISDAAWADLLAGEAE